MPGMKEKHDATMIDAGDRHAILVIDIRIFDPNGHVAIGKIRCLERLHRHGDCASDFSQQQPCNSSLVMVFS
jgi:hypothetical protein